MSFAQTRPAAPQTADSAPTERPSRSGGIQWHRPLPPLPRREAPGVLVHVTVAGPVECSFCFHNSTNPLNCTQCESFCCPDDARCEEQHQASCPDRRAQIREAGFGVPGLLALVAACLFLAFMLGTAHPMVTAAVMVVGVALIVWRFEDPPRPAQHEREAAS